MWSKNQTSICHNPRFIMRSLKNILQDVPVESVVGSIDRSVSNIQYDSRSVEQDTIFVAIKGLKKTKA